MPPRAPVVAAPLVLALLLAGCTTDDGTDGGDGAPAGTDAEPVAAGLQLPAWALRDSWTYTTMEGGSFTDVVVDEAPGDWIVATTDQDQAFFDARYDISHLGRVRKSDLAGSQGEDRVQFFKWPLLPGDSWVTTWDRETVSVRVTDVTDASATLEARAGDAVRVVYSYDAAAGHFGSATFYDGNGTARYAFTLASSGHGFTGEVASWELVVVEEREGVMGATPAPWQGQFTVPEGATDVYVAFDLACTQGAVAFGVAPGEHAAQAAGMQEGYGVAQPCPVDARFAGPVAAPPTPGKWSYGFAGTSAAGDVPYRALIIVRTLVTTAVS